MSATAALTAFPSPSHGLVRVFFNEYTAGSVAEHPLDASALNLVRSSDGNYVNALLAISASGSPAARSTSTVQSGLYNLKLGG